MVKTLHQDHLLPIGYLVRFPSNLDVKQTPQKPLTRLRQKEEPVQKTNQVEHLEDEHEYWNMHADRRDDILCAIDLLADQLSRDAPLDITPAEVSPHDSAEEEIDVDIEEVLDTFSEGPDTEQTQQLPKDPVVDTGLEGGELLPTSQSQSSAEPFCNRPARRQVKPVVRLSYDRPGHSTNEPIVVVHRELRVTIKRDSPVLYPSWDNL